MMRPSTSEWQYPTHHMVVSSCAVVCMQSFNSILHACTRLGVCSCCNCSVLILAVFQRIQAMTGCMMVSVGVDSPLKKGSYVIFSLVSVVDIV